ncbi:tetratricopeptide repeat protein [Flavobacterium sp. XS1P32]|uniref:tetratricopeptide repeat protein n=1 Tax=Flavobacterium sp. XS1P32 TaxID=3401726 RepID=UPI003AAD098D
MILFKAKNFLNATLVYLVLFLIVYLIANVVHLIWYIADIEGFWGVSYFFELLRIAVLVIGLSIFVIVIIGLLLSSLFSVFKKGAGKNDFLKLFGVLLFVIIISVFNYFFYNGFSLYLTKSLSDKYSYIEKTEEYIRKGESNTALDYAKKSYEKELNKSAVSPFLFITKLYSGSDFAQKQRLISEYAAIINYGFCLKENLNSDRKAEKLFNDAISISNNFLLKSEKENLQIFPVLSLAEINLSKGNYLVAENYFNKLSKLNKKSQPEDVVYLINSKMLFADQALRIGDIKKTMELNIENLHLYEISELSKTSANYLSLLLLATTSELYLQHYKSAGELLIKAQSLADEKTDESIYLQYLLVKGNYCYQVALNQQGNKKLIYKSWWNKFVGFFTKGKSLKEEFITEAEKCFIESVDETKSRTGDYNIQYVESLNRLAVFYSNTGRFVNAQNIFKKAITILKPLKNDYKDYYNKLLISSLVINDSGKSIDENIFETIEVQLFNKITSNYLFLTEDEKEKFISNIERDITSINLFYLKQNTFRDNERLYNNILATKNIALYSNQNLRNFISKADGSLKSDYIKLLNEKERLSLLSKKENSEELQWNLKLKEREIIAKVYKNPLFQIYNPRLVQWNDIKKALKVKETAIEIINVPISYLEKQDFQYYALIIKPDSKYPEIIPLFKESNLTTILNAKGETEQRVNAIYYENKYAVPIFQTEISTI